MGRPALLAVLAVSGTLLAARGLFGPFAVNSPMNVEGIFALAFLALLLTRNVEARAVSSHMPSLFWAALLTAIVTAAFAGGLNFPLLADDYAHIWNARHADARALWAHFTVAEEDGFFRPAVYVSYAMDAAWAGLNPAAWRASDLAMHVVNTLLVFGLCREIGLAKSGAFLGALVFGLHGSRPEAVTWVAARFDLLAVMFSLGCILAVLRGRARWAAWLLLGLALFSKESAYVTPAIVAALLWYRGERWLAVTAPLVGIEAIAFAYRTWVLNGIGGYHNAVNGSPTIFNFGFSSTLKALFLRFWGVMIFPLNWIGGLGRGLGIALAAAIGALCYLAWRGAERRKVLLGIAIATICSLPVHQFLSIGPDLEKARVLYMASIGLAVLVAALFENMDWKLVPFAAALVGFQLAALESNLEHWKNVGYLAERTCRTGAEKGELAAAGLPNVVDGVYFLHTGFPECVLFLAPELKRDGARELYWDGQARVLRER